MNQLFSDLKYHRLNFFKAMLVLATISIVSGCETKPLPKRGDTAPDFSATDITGTLVGRSQLKGNIAILYFWTNSCCGARLKLLEPLYRSNKRRGLAFLAINVGDPREVVESYAQYNGVTFTMLPDKQKTISNQFGVIGFPTIFILDRNGVLREKIHGEIQPEQLQKLVERQFDIQKEVEASYEKTHAR